VTAAPVAAVKGGNGHVAQANGGQVVYLLARSNLQFAQKVDWLAASLGGAHGVRQDAVGCDALVGIRRHVLLQDQRERQGHARVDLGGGYKAGGGGE